MAMGKVLEWDAVKKTGTVSHKTQLGCAMMALYSLKETLVSTDGRLVIDRAVSLLGLIQENQDNRFVADCVLTCIVSPEESPLLFLHDYRFVMFANKCDDVMVRDLSVEDEPVLAGLFPAEWFIKLEIKQ